MNIWIDMTTMRDAKGKSAYYYPQVHWTVDDSDFEFSQKSLDELKLKLEDELNNFFKNEMNPKNGKENQNSERK